MPKERCGGAAKRALVIWPVSCASPCWLTGVMEEPCVAIGRALPAITLSTKALILIFDAE